MHLLNKQWKYINEGNVHIVLEIVNTKYVYRLIKDDSQTNYEFVRQCIEYANFVILALIQNTATYEEEIVTISQEELEELTIKLAKIRPQKRQNKSSISQFVIKAPNLTILNPTIDNYCIEIKPKEGFLAKSLQEHLKCYYCLKQFLKLSNREISNVSDYCPLDLYSGNENRMKFALLNLIRNPQNNFKMFKNGNVVFGEHSSINDFEDIIQSTILKTTDIFLHMLIMILLSDGNSDIILDNKEVKPLKVDSNCVEGNELPEKSLLNKLLHLQRLSNDLHIDNLTSYDNYKYVSEVLDRLNAEGLNLRCENDRKKFLKSTEKIQLAMISAIAKDCSIMIVFTEQHCDGYPNIIFQNKKFSYRMAVTDLEPKSVKSLVKRTKTEKQLVEIYEKNKQNKI